MSRIAVVFMVLLLSICGYALDNVPDSTRVDTPSNVECDADGNRDEEKKNRAKDHGDIGEPVPSLREKPFSHTDWLTAVGTVIIAIFTVALAWTSCLQWKAIKKTNETTKASVESYVGRERGRLILKSLSRASGRGGNSFEYQFVNAGPTGLVVSGFGCTVVREVAAEDGSAGIDPLATLQLSAISYYVKSGGCFGVQESGDALIATKSGIGAVPEDVAQHDRSTDNNIVAVFDIAYDTSFGAYQKREVASFSDFGHVGFPDGTLSYDLLHAEWIEKHGKKEEKKK